MRSRAPASSGLEIRERKQPSSGWSFKANPRAEDPAPGSRRQLVWSVFETGGRWPGHRPESLVEQLGQQGVGLAQPCHHTVWRACNPPEPPTSEEGGAAVAALNSYFSTSSARWVSGLVVQSAVSDRTSAWRDPTGQRAPTMGPAKQPQLAHGLPPTPRIMHLLLRHRMCETAVCMLRHDLHLGRLQC